MIAPRFTVYPKLLAVILSSATAACLLLGLDLVGCTMRKCEANNMGMEALLVFWIPTLLLYIIFTWLVVFSTMLFVRKWLNIYSSSFVVSLISSLAVAWLFHRSEVDSSFLHTVKHLVPFLGIPWFFGGTVAMLIWPKSSAKIAT